VLSSTFKHFGFGGYYLKNNPNLDFRSLTNEITQLESKNHSRWDICRGHDVTHVFLLVVKKLIQEESNNKTRKRKNEHISHEYIEESLRKAIRQGDFDNKKLYKEVSHFIANVCHTSSNQSV
jgi:hypothetical protein